MRFENRALVPVERERLWGFLSEMPNVARCMPGVEGFTDLGSDRYAATLKVRVGPIALRLEGQVDVISRDRETWSAIMRAHGDEKGVGGAVEATVKLVLGPGPQGQTELTVATDASVLGRLGEFGQPVMRRKADSIMQEFARNVANEFAVAPPVV